MPHGWGKVVARDHAQSASANKRRFVLGVVIAAVVGIPLMLMAAAIFA